MLVGIVVMLGNESLRFFTSGQVSLVNFLTGNVWQPQTGEFGIRPLVVSTLITSAIAMVVSIPMGLCAAIYIAEYSKPKARAVLKPAIETLAAVPTVVFGFFAVTVITPILQSLLGDAVSFYNRTAAGIAIGILIFPQMTSMIEDALISVPRSQRRASNRLGATKFETTVLIVVPTAITGILSAIILGFSTAIGETMIVALSSGAGPNASVNPLQFGETLTGYIARISGGDVSYGSNDYLSIFGLGIVLIIITIGLNILSIAIRKRFQRRIAHA